MKIILEAETKEIADILSAVKSQHKYENIKLYPEKTNFLDCLKDVLKATHDTCGEQLQKNVHNAG